MDRDNDGRLVLLVEFTVRNDKNRGLLIEKIDTDQDEYFFKYQDQCIHRHCDQMQIIIRRADVKRTKKIRVDLTEFPFEYYQNGKVSFKGIPLNSTKQQIQKACDKNINKEVAAMKRSDTLAQNKVRKIDEYNSKILKRLEQAEQRYQQQRAMRINQVFGGQSSGEPNNSGSPPDPNAAIPQNQASEDQQATQSQGNSSKSARIPPVLRVVPQRSGEEVADVEMNDDIESVDISMDYALPSDDDDL